MARPHPPQPEPQPLARPTRRRLGLFVLALNLLLLLVVVFMVWWMVAMPGRSFSGALPPLDAREARYEKDLRDLVGLFAGEIGERNVGRPQALQRASEEISATLGDMGYLVRGERFPVGGGTASNVVAERRGKTHPDEVVIVGAHYDTVKGSPGADDNGSGTAAMLALARAFSHASPERTLRFVAFANEEAPFFGTDAMGSRVYARGTKARGEKVRGMLSLESLGFYSDAPGSQKYPAPLSLFYPDRGDFVAFVGNVRSRALVREAVGRFRASARIPSEGAALPDSIPGVGWSDHWAFWQEGYPALMVTDTAPFRNPHYHTAGDTPETLDFPRLARVCAGLEDVVAQLASR